MEEKTATKEMRNPSALRKSKEISPRLFRDENEARMPFVPTFRKMLPQTHCGSVRE